MNLWDDLFKKPLAKQRIQVDGFYKFTDVNLDQCIRECIKHQWRLHEHLWVNGRSLRGSRFALETSFHVDLPLIETPAGIYVGPSEGQGLYPYNNNSYEYSITVPHQRVLLEP